MTFRACVILCCFTLVGVTGSAQETELRFGGEIPPDVDTICDRGLEWLASNQSENGDWPGGQNGPGITGMAVMAFLSSGEDPNFGRYSENIRRAVRNIIGQQNGSTGYFGNSMYHHGFATLGLSEVYGVLDEDLLWQGQQGRSVGEALDLAVRASITAQKNNQWGGWRYSPTSTDADTSVSGAVLMGLLAARNAGIKVPDESIDKALKYFEQMTSNQGSVGYSGIGSFGGSNNLKAISALVLAIGKRKDLDKYEAVLKQCVNNIEQNEASYPFYNRYYMAQALFQGDVDAWQKWNLRTIRILKEMQNDDGSFTGSHGQAYATSMSLLALALNYRFLPIYER